MISINMNDQANVQQIKFQNCDHNIQIKKISHKSKLLLLNFQTTGENVQHCSQSSHHILNALTIIYVNKDNCI